MILIKEEHPDEDNFKENSSFKSQTETFNVNFNFKTEIKQNVEESIFKSDFVITEPIIKAEEELMTNSMAEQYVLQIHDQVVHQGIKRHPCNLCDAKWGMKITLLKHLREVHKVGQIKTN